MNIHTAEKPEIKLVGVSIRTTNAEEMGPSGRLPGLWEAYFNSNLTSKRGINNPDLIYALYTDYESDVTGAYTVVIGHEVSDDGPPVENNDKYAVIPESKYMVFTSKKGPVYEVVAQAWADIWAYFRESPDARAYTGDFELYDSRNFDPTNTEVQIYIAVK